MTTPLAEPIVPSVEAISHQVDTKLFDAMVFAFENTTSTKELSRIIPDIIAEHTGVLTEFHIEPSDEIDAWVYTPDLNKNHPFIDECRRQWYTSADASKLFRTERAKVLTALIDRRNSRVSGAFTKVVCPIYITRGLLFGTFPNMAYDSKPKSGSGQQPEQPRVRYGTRFTAREVAASVLHEVGHIFSYYESLADALTTNWVLGAASEAFFATNDQTVRIQVARDVEDALKIELGDATQIAEKITDKESFHVLILSECERASRSRLGAHIYDLRSWESASDQFASRHGASLALATSLDKMYRIYGADDRHGKIAHWVMEIIKVIQVLMLTTLGVALIATPLFAAGIIIIIILVAVGLFSNPFDEIYDPHKFRLGRIRQDVISRLKTRHLPKAYVERTIKEFDVIEKIVSDVQHHETLWRKVWVFCSSATRKQRDKMTMQQELELLANNELYITAARLRVLI